MKLLFRTISINILLLTSSLPSFAQSNGSWSQKPNFGGTGRSNAVGFSIGSYGYIGTGYTGTLRKDFWRYDPSNDSWTQMSDFGGTARWGATGFVIGNFGYIGTGNIGSGFTKDFWRYDASGNSWSQIADFGGSGRSFAASFAIGNNGFVGTGSNASQSFNDFWKYNSTTGTWTARANFGTNVNDCFAFALNGKGYVGCGKDFSGSTYYNTFYQYDTTANAWTSKANFAGTVREGANAFVIGNYGYAGTGSITNFTVLYADFYKYDPIGNSWSAAASFIGPPRTNSASFAIGNYGYLGTGYTLGYAPTFYRYDLCGVILTATATPSSCNGGNNGYVNLTVANATNPYTYAWSNASTKEDVTGLSSGTYSVMVTDMLGCSKTLTVSVTQPTPLVGTITTVTNASCAAPCNGKMTAVATGSAPPYTYLWAPNGASTASCTGLCPGMYTVTITDSKGCTTTDTASVSSAQLAISFSVTTTSCPTCTNGTATGNPSGGTAPYTYLWNNGQTTQIATGLLQGTYTLCITDTDSCIVCNTVTVTVSAGIFEYDPDHISIYPNPIREEFTISGLTSPIKEVEITNIIGEVVYRATTVRQHTSVVNPSEATIHLSSIHEGIYVLKIKTSEFIFTKKIILMK